MEWEWAGENTVRSLIPNHLFSLIYKKKNDKNKRFSTYNSVARAAASIRVRLFPRTCSRLNRIKNKVIWNIFLCTEHCRLHVYLNTQKQRQRGREGVRCRTRLRKSKENSHATRVNCSFCGLGISVRIFHVYLLFSLYHNICFWYL